MCRAFGVHFFGPPCRSCLVVLSISVFSRLENCPGVICLENTACSLPRRKIDKEKADWKPTLETCEYIYGKRLASGQFFVATDIRRIPALATSELVICVLLVHFMTKNSSADRRETARQPISITPFLSDALSSPGELRRITAKAYCRQKLE